jgi:type IX secretion system PorP/SprF family membrane protein
MPTYNLHFLPEIKKITMRKFYTLLLALIVGGKMQGQDLHFSQYHSSPVHLNPTMVGLMHNGNVITLNYRDQWRPILGAEGAFRTIAGTFEKRINTTGNNFFGAGLGVFQDKAGTLTQSEAKLAVSYARLLAKHGKAHYYILGGGQGGVMQSDINPTDRRWLSQYDGQGGYDASKPGESVDFPKKTMLDVSMGMAFFTQYDNQNFWVVGASIHHLNRADLSTTKYSTLPIQYMRYTVHGTGSFFLGNSHFRLLPSALLMKQGPSLEMTPGVALKYVLDRTDYRSFQIGGMVRTVNKLDNKLQADAIIGFVRADWVNYGVGFSYDFNTSLLNASNRANNSVELSLIYKFEAEIMLKKKVTPRYF